MNTVYQEYSPPSRLSMHLECFWSVEATADTRQIVVPDGCMDILLRMDKGVYAIDIIGSMTRTENAVIRSGHTYIGARFKPGRICEVASVDCSLIVDAARPLHSSIGATGGDLAERVDRAFTTEEKIEQLERSLNIKSDPLSAQRAIEALVASDGQLSAAELSDIAELSERHLRRQFIVLTGLPPKILARVLRFRRAHRMISANATRGLAELAVECGYSDQAHFSHEFAKFAGRTPALFAKSLA